MTTNREGKLNEAVYRSLTGQSLERVALKPAVTDYLLRCTPRVSHGTLRAYKSALNGLLESVHATNTKPDLADITKDVLEKYLANYRLRASAKSCNNKVKYLGSFFREADQKHHTGDPTKHIAIYYETPAEADAPDRRPFTSVELGKIYSVAPGGFWKFAIKCAYFTGFRLGRIATLQWQHVNFEKRIFDVKDVKPQKKEKIAVPIMDALFSDLKALRILPGNLKPTGFLWPAQAQTYREQGAAPLSYEFHRVVLVLAGLAIPYRHGGERRVINEVTFHSIKHNLVTGSAAIPTLNVTQNRGLVINPNVTLTKAQYRFSGKFQNGKPVFQIPSGKIINFVSAFGHKLLCNGLTFTLGLLCHFMCSFCYVEGLLSRHPTVIRIRKEYGLEPSEFAIERQDPLPGLLRELVDKNGNPRFSNPDDTRVIFSSPLVDCAANRATAQRTVEACRLILKYTNWQIRLLSKSADLRWIGEQLSEFKDRVIYGFSTGTFDDKLAIAFEQGTSSPTARLRALYWLQDNGYRTFAMICPSLPQPDYDVFAVMAAEKVRVDRCEDYWCEVLNVRGKSLSKTYDALKKGGFVKEVAELIAVSQDKKAWENYARATFLAHAQVVPASKLKFMQYVRLEHLAWWRKQQGNGAILLGKHAE